MTAACQFVLSLNIYWRNMGRKHKHIFKENSTLLIWKFGWISKNVYRF
jgi:hypothetical protein